MKYVFLLVITLSFACAAPQKVILSPDIEVDSQAAFSKLQTLEGSWKRKGTDGTAFQIVFSLSANKTLLIEDWQRKGKSHSLTVYHRDNAGLLATHYCPQGNQPRLRMTKGNDSMVSFIFQDGTHLTADSSHQSELSFEFVGESLLRKEKYSKDPKVSLLELERVN